MLLTNTNLVFQEEKPVQYSTNNLLKWIISPASQIKKIRSAFELHEENVMNSKYLLDYNLKPRDVLDIIPDSDIKKFVELKEIKSRGDLIDNILEQYKDSENLYLENYENIVYR